MPRLKVLHLITTLPRVSGAADNTRWTVNLLNRDRYEAHLAFGPADQDHAGLSDDVRTFVVRGLQRQLSPRADLLAFGRLRRLIRRERYDIVHTHNSKAGVLGRLAAWRAGTPVIVHTAHTISFVASTSRLANLGYLWADRLCARISDQLVTVSSLNTQRYLDARIGRAPQYRTIYSGVDSSRFLQASGRAACRQELAVGPEQPLLTWIGRLNRQKDPLTFVAACRIIADHFPYARILMIGEDSIGESLEAEVRKAIHAYRLEGIVQLLGYRADVDRILAASDVVVHSSLYEGLGRSIVEAMLAGTPIVATSVDGVREAILSGVRGGLLVEPQNPRALATSAIFLLEHPDEAKRMALAGKEWARDRFEVRQMVAAIDAMYQELYARRIDRRSTP